MNSEKLGLLVGLNEAYRSDIHLLNARIAKMSAAEVDELLERAISSMKSERLLPNAGTDVRAILSEVTPGMAAKRAQLVEEYARLGVSIRTIWDSDYPARLRELDSPPLVLIIEGTTFPGRRPIAIVGTREAGQIGIAETRALSRDLATLGHTIVSGLARGIDAAAHRGALDAKGTTVAILAGDLGHIYPPENRSLCRDIVQNGAAVSEVSPYGTMHRARFVERNRITSGVSEAVVVGEFHGSGGTLHQVRFAISQGRPVFALRQPAEADGLARRGAAMLEEMGAVIIRGADELERSLEVPGSASFKPRHKRTRQSNLPESG